MTKEELEQKYAPDRRNTNSYKWDAMVKKFGTNELMPLWVADMDFSSPDCVKDAVKRQADFGVYGYYVPPDSYYNAVMGWEEKRHGYKIKREWLRYTCGVVPGIYWMIQILTQQTDKCMILTPSYYPFMEAIQDTGRTLICNELKQNSGKYYVDIAQLEKNIIDNQVKVFILCSPHNPTGRVWLKNELKEMLDVCKKHHVYVISDEIHQDIIMSGHEQIPAATVGEYDHILVTLSAASKTFNLAGLQNAFIIIPDDELRNKFDQYALKIQNKKGSSFGYIATEAVYTGGKEWLEAVLGVIEDNYTYLKETFEKKAPLVEVTPLEGTYLAWIDLGAYVEFHDLRNLIENECKLAVDYGNWFFPEKGREDTHIRINLATPRKNIREAVECLIDKLTNVKKNEV